MNPSRRHILFLPPNFQPHQAQVLHPIRSRTLITLMQLSHSITRRGCRPRPTTEHQYARPQGQIQVLYQIPTYSFTLSEGSIVSIQVAHTNSQVVPRKHLFAQHQINAHAVHMRQFGYHFLPQQNPNIPGLVPFAPNHIFNEADGQRLCVPPCLCNHTFQTVHASANSGSSSRPPKWPWKVPIQETGLDGRSVLGEK